MEFRNMNTGEIVDEQDAKAYVKEKIGFPAPKGKFGEYTPEQLEAIDMLIEWYFSNWIEQEVKNELYG